MSRIGKKPINIDNTVTVNIHNSNVVDISGPKGTITRRFNPLVSIKFNKQINELTVDPCDDSLKALALWGLSRTLLYNMVQGVTNGFIRILEIVGVGYRAEVSGNNLKLTLGYSHIILFNIPKGIGVSVVKGIVITLTSIDKELIGQTAANIRSLKPPEVYKGKGIRYQGEIIRRKAGKASSK